jgi:acyl carrier protein
MNMTLDQVNQDQAERRMDEEQIRSALRAFIAKDLLFSDGSYPYEDDSSFLREGIVDSMGIVELVAFVSDTYQIEVTRDEVVLDHFDSIERLAAFVTRKLTTDHPPSLPKLRRTS